MDLHRQENREKRIQKTMENLRKNRMEAYYVPTAQEVIPQLEQLLHEGDTVAAGGSMSLFESGVIEYLRGGKYHFLDRYAEGLTPEQVREIYLRSFDADAYLCSSNAVTEQGELYNVDGNSNRVAAISYGPRSVIMVVGVNKIVRNLPAAVERVKRIAAPSNCQRLHCDTPCRQTGECVSLKKERPFPCDGCGTEHRICCTYTISAMQRVPGRMKVILVGEELGY